MVNVIKKLGAGITATLCIACVIFILLIPLVGAFIFSSILYDELYNWKDEERFGVVFSSFIIFNILYFYIATFIF